MIVIDAAALGARTHLEVKAIQDEQQKSRREQGDAIAASKRWRQEDEARDIFRWISAADYRTLQSDFFQRPQDGAGQWLLDSVEYKNWCGNEGAVLYYHGMPGAGKTIMTSVVIHDLHSECGNDPGTGIAYLYCNFRRQDEQNATNMQASMLKQLVAGRPQMPSGVIRLYEKHYVKQTRPSLGEIVSELQSVVDSYPRSFIVVDALDECPISEGGRQVFVSELLNL